LNTVNICYILYSPVTRPFSVDVQMSSDSGATWNVPLNTLWNHAGDFGDSVFPGTHCFNWAMNTDFPGHEGYNFLVRVSAMTTYFVDSFAILDTTEYVINGNDGYVAPDSEYFVLTQNTYLRNGRLVTVDSFYCDTLMVEFDFKFNPGFCDIPAESTGADGIALIFSPLVNPPLSLGGSIGIIGCLGWGVEFDTYNNYCGSGSSDIDGNHTAVSIDDTACYFTTDPVPVSLSQVNIPFELVDATWHHARVLLQYPNCRVYLDGVSYIDASFPGLPAPFWAHIGLSASTGACWSEHLVDNFIIYGDTLQDTVISVDTARAPLDSDPPDADITCPNDTVEVGDTMHLSWSVNDLFWRNAACSLRISWCTSEFSTIVAGTSYDWIVPPAAEGCDSFWFNVSVRDSFCNWGEDSCLMQTECNPALAQIICGPCGTFTGCANQIVRFEIVNPSGFAIDTTKTYFTVMIHHIIGGTDVIHLNEPTPRLSFSCRCDSVITIVSGITFVSGDSVVVSIDSLYDVRGCLTDF